MSPGSTHWNAHALRWQLIGAPLRPAAADLEFLRATVDRYRAQAGPASALLLGVTPEIAEMTWDFPLTLVAVDKSEGMVNGVWPGDTATRRAVVGDWLSMQLAEAPFELVLGDGVFTLFDYPQGYATLAAVLARFTQVGALFCVRAFCRVTPAEPLERVFADAFEGRIGNFNVFKWRLAMALQGDATRGVRLARIWDAFSAGAGSVESFAARSGFPAPVVGTIAGYRDVDDCYSFSTESEVARSLAPHFELLESWHPTYELGERCPHLTFRRCP